MTDGLELALSLLEAEQTFAEHLITTGVMPVGPYRQPTVAELQAGTRFAALAAIVDDAAHQLAAIADRVRTATIEALVADLADLTPAEIVQRLAQLVNNADGAAVSGAAGFLGGATQEASTILARAYDEGALEALDEATRQDVPVEGMVVRRAADDPEVLARLTARAADVAYGPYRQVLEAARVAALNAPAMAGAEVRAHVADQIAGLSTKPVEDLARQAAGVAHDSGRTAGLEAVVAGPVGQDGGRVATEIYASELLDGNTCEPCSHVDQRSYDTLEEGLVDYPGYGGYVGCLGGARCRGTLVVVWGEAASTTDQPGAGPRGQVVDRSQRGPSGVARPDHIDANGSVIVRSRT